MMQRCIKKEREKEKDNQTGLTLPHYLQMATVPGAE